MPPKGSTRTKKVIIYDDGGESVIADSSERKGLQEFTDSQANSLTKRVSKQKNGNEDNGSKIKKSKQDETGIR